MKKQIMFALGLAAIFAAACSSSKTENKFETKLADNFENPSSDFRSAPFWVWNCDVTKEDIDFSLGQYKDKGFGGAFLHPRFGMKTEYLSPEWFDLVAHAEKKCAELGLNLWIYDENSYPSGFAGGHVPDQMPESQSDGYAFVPQKLKKLSAADVEANQIILARDGEGFRDITAEAKSHIGKDGEFFVYKKLFFAPTPWFAGKGYVDILKKGVTEKFLEVTMTGYKKTVGDKFGKTVKGSFTDEPEIMGRNKIRWTTDMFELFQKKFGYDLKVNLPSLSERVGDWKKVRHDYHAMLLELFVERWSKPYKKFCDDNNLHFTGHYWEHGWPLLHSGPDNMAMAAYHHMPAIDMLFNRFNEESCGAQFGNVRSVKEVSSIANQTGRQRVLSETYGGASWMIDFERMKMFADWQFVLGINFVNQHVGHISMAGVRKYDYPPMFSAAASWWESYKPLNDYIARMSVLASSGKEKNEILVLEPTTSLWANSGISDFGAALKIGSAFQSFITNMSKKQLEYDLACEHVLETCGKAENGRFVVGECAYKYFVVTPLTENIESATFDLLKKFVSQGGKVVAYARPSMLDGRENAEVKKFFQSVPLETRPIESLLKNADVEFSNVKGGNILHQTRAVAGGTLVILANINQNEKASLDVSAAAKSVSLLDCVSGETREVPFESENGRVKISLEVKPVESFALVFSGAEKASPKKEKAEEIEIASDVVPQAERIRDNVLCVDFVDFKMGDADMKNAYFFDANDRAFKIAGFERGNPWFQAMQFKKEFARDFSKVPPMRVSYKFDVAEGAKTEGMKALVERANMYKVSLNGKPLSAGGKTMLDRQMNVLDISSAVKTGENILTLELDKFNLDAEIEPVYILGAFSVEDAGGKWRIAKEKPLSLGSLKKQGAPFYPWEVSYSKNVVIDDTGASYFVSAPKADAIVCEVWVNGEKVGVILTRSDKIDISKSLRKGANKIEVRAVCGMENFFGPFFEDVRSKGIAGPQAWKKKVDNAKPSDYFISDYGLREDFTITKIKK